MSEFRNLPQEEQRRLWDDLGAPMAELARLLFDPSPLEALAQELNAFLLASGIELDAIGEMDFAEVLDDARTILAILEKYRARNYIPPAPPPSRGPTPDEFWEDMARRELQENWKRKHTIAEYLKGNPRTFVSPKEMKAYVRKAIFDARKRLGITPRRKN